METQQLDDATKYQNWRSQLTKNQNAIRSIEPLYVHRAKKEGNVLYALLKLDAQAAEGTTLNPICFLKGDAVSMLVVLIAEETNEKYVALVK